jgi:hypothetical protein
MSASWNTETGPTSGARLWTLATKAHFVINHKEIQIKEMREFLESDDFQVAKKMLLEYSAEVKVMEGPGKQDHDSFNATRYVLTKNGFQKFTGHKAGGHLADADLNEFWDTFYTSQSHGSMSPVALLHKVLDGFATEKMKKAYTPAS